MEAIYFASAAAFGDWLAEHHATETEVLVGYWKVGSGQPSLTWAESVDEALCVGWIDAIRRRVDDARYTIRFTRRKPGSTWSNVNIARVAELEAAGRMTAAGRAAFAARREERSGIYAFERAVAAELTADEQARFEAASAAWTWFAAQAPWYRRTALHWVTSAKRAETRERRLAILIEESAAGQKPRQWRY